MGDDELTLKSFGWNVTINRH